MNPSVWGHSPGFKKPSILDASRDCKSLGVFVGQRRAQGLAVRGFQVRFRQFMATFYDRFVECCEKWPNNVAVEIQATEGLESHSYADLRRMAESVAYWLLSSGYKPGARCAILAGNHPRWVAAYLGIIAAGCTAVPLDTAFSPEQVAKLLKDSGSSLLFHDQEHAARAQEAARDLNPVVATTDLGGRFAAPSPEFRLAEVGAEEIAALLYTSGTTADPKGVMLTHANLLGEAKAVFAWANIGPGDAVLGVLPLFHALAQMANLLLPLASGARVVYLKTLNTTELLRALAEREITAFACVPQFFYLIHERIEKEMAQRGSMVRGSMRGLKRLNRFARAWGWNPGKLFFRPIHRMFGSRMRYLVTGGSRWDPQVGREFYDLGVDILQAYGLTETTGGAFATAPEQNVIGSVGKPLPGVEAIVVDAQEQESGPAIGEILIRGPIVMPGYWNRPDATAEILSGGWLHTGDLGYFDAKGNLFITGRKKEVIVLSSGKNVYPEEIEAHYQKSTFIKEVCVLGLVSGDPPAERLHAVVVPNFEALKQRKIVNAREVIRFDIEGLSQKLASTKRILSYEIWQEDLPRTSTRKLKRFEIEKKVGQNQKRGTSDDVEAERPLSAEEVVWLEEAEVRRALKVLGQASRDPKRSIRPDDNLELDLGLDSMQRVELLTALEHELGGRLEEARALEIYTVRDLVDTVRASAGKADGTRRTAPPGWSAILVEDVRDPEVLALRRNRPISAGILFVATRLLQLVARDLFQLKVFGLEKLPVRGPFIISPNHQSFIDPLVVASVLPWPVFRNLFSVGTSEIFGFGPMRALARFLRVIVVDPDANLIPAMRAGAYGLQYGRVLMLFPEGERSIDGNPKVFKKGAAILASNLSVPIVPVAISGAYEVWPRGKKFFQRVHPVKLAFGDPIYPQSSHPGEAEYSQTTWELRQRVTGMWTELQAGDHASEVPAAD